MFKCNGLYIINVAFKLYKIIHYHKLSTKMQYLKRDLMMGEGGEFCVYGDAQEHWVQTRQSALY